MTGLVNRFRAPGLRLGVPGTVVRLSQPAVSRLAARLEGKGPSRDRQLQSRLFAKEVVPAVRAQNS